MKKFAMSVAAVTMLIGGLTACGNNGTDDQGTGTGTNDRNDTYEGQTYGNPYGVNNYSSNYGRNNDTFTNGRSRYRGQGPVSDMLTPDGRYRGATYGNFDRSRPFSSNYNTMNQRNGNRANNQVGMRSGNNTNNYGMRSRGYTGNNQPGMVGQDGLLQNDMYRYNGGVRGNNYDSRIYNNARNSSNVQNRLNAQNRAMNYHKDYDSQTAQKIAQSVKQINGVDDVWVIVNNKDVVVGVHTNQNVNNIQKEVEQKVKSLTKGKNVHVSSERDVVDRIRTLDDRLRTGTPFQEVGQTFTDMVRDIGNAVTRPFR